MHTVADFRLWSVSKLISEADKNMMAGDKSSGQNLLIWERLSASLKRITDAGVAEATAKQNICNAIADRAIRFRCELRKRISRGTTARGKVIFGADVDISAHLDPQDIDFENSRPLKPWLIARERIPFLAGYWTIEWVKLLKTDVTEHLIFPFKSDQQYAPNGPHRKPAQRRKGQPSRERAWRVISQLYPNGVPDQATEPNAILCKRVATRLNEQKLPNVSDETILRAAGRRK
jgi:hypothetical protein